MRKNQPEKLEYCDPNDGKWIALSGYDESLDNEQILEEWRDDRYRLLLGQWIGTIRMRATGPPYAVKMVTDKVMASSEAEARLVLGKIYYRNADIVNVYRKTDKS